MRGRSRLQSEPHDGVGDRPTVAHTRGSRCRRRYQRQRGDHRKPEFLHDAGIEHSLGMNVLGALSNPVPAPNHHKLLRWHRRIAWRLKSRGGGGGKRKVEKKTVSVARYDGGTEGSWVWPKEVPKGMQGGRTELRCRLSSRKGWARCTGQRHVDNILTRT
jgi:hypothetical protein